MIEDSLVFIVCLAHPNVVFSILTLVIFQKSSGTISQRGNESLSQQTHLRCTITGEMRDDKKYMSMMEDFAPRREGGRGTEITTLQVDKTSEN